MKTKALAGFILIAASLTSCVPIDESNSSSSYESEYTGSDLITDPEELLSYCLGANISQSLQYDFTDAELDAMESGLLSGTPEDSELSIYRENFLVAISDFRSMPVMDTYLTLANAIADFNFRCTDIYEAN